MNFIVILKVIFLYFVIVGNLFEIISLVNVFNKEPFLNGLTYALELFFFNLSFYCLIREKFLCLNEIFKRMKELFIIKKYFCYKQLFEFNSTKITIVKLE